MIFAEFNRLSIENTYKNLVPKADAFVFRYDVLTADVEYNLFEN